MVLDAVTLGAEAYASDEEIAMRPRIALMILLSLLTLSIGAPVTSAGATETWEGHTDEASVRLACGRKLQSGGGVIGCTKKCGDSVCDWSCGGPQGDDCRVIVFPGRLQTSQETQSPLGDHPLVQSPGGDQPTAEKLLQVFLNASKAQVVRACTEVKGIGLTATKPPTRYGCYNPKKDVLVACFLKAEECIAYLPKPSRFKTLRWLLGAVNMEEGEESKTSKSSGGGDSVGDDDDDGIILE